MKSAPKLIVSAACALAFSGALLAGCSSSNSDQEILDKLNQMETEINQLQSQQSGDAAATGTQSDATTNAGVDPNASTASSGDAAETDFESAIADFESRATAAADTANAVAVPQDSAARPQAYFDAKAPLETLQNESDMLEDRIEAAYRQGSLDRETLWSYDNRLNAAENTLDRAEDDLELRMGVDD